MASTPTTATKADASKSEAPKAAAPALPQLLPLEDDDEFEEFKATDWEEKDTYGAKLGSSTGEDGKKAGLDSLWEDNWDDDDVEDDFGQQLRAELAKQDKMET